MSYKCDLSPVEASHVPLPESFFVFSLVDAGQSVHKVDKKRGKGMIFLSQQFYHQKIQKMYHFYKRINKQYIYYTYVPTSCGRIRDLR